MVALIIKLLIILKFGSTLRRHAPCYRKEIMDRQKGILNRMSTPIYLGLLRARFEWKTNIHFQEGLRPFGLEPSIG
jgi:hypothetical protein